VNILCVAKVSATLPNLVFNVLASDARPQSPNTPLSDWDLGLCNTDRIAGYKGFQVSFLYGVGVLRSDGSSSIRMVLYRW